MRFWMWLAVFLLSGPVMAEQKPVNLTADLPEVTIETPDGPATIRRNQDNEAMIDPDWAMTSRACPPFCIQPMSPAPGVTTIGELELIALLQDPEAVVMDSRTVKWFQGGSIPGAVSVPYTEVADRLGDLGCEPDFDGWDCTAAKTVALFCNGNWCGQSPSAIRVMISAGFPAERINYYRGGMHAWRMLGLTVTAP